MEGVLARISQVSNFAHFSYILHLLVAMLATLTSCRLVSVTFCLCYLKTNLAQSVLLIDYIRYSRTGFNCDCLTIVNIVSAFSVRNYYNGKVLYFYIYTRMCKPYMNAIIKNAKNTGTQLFCYTIKTGPTNQDTEL